MQREHTQTEEALMSSRRSAVNDIETALLKALGGLLFATRLRAYQVTLTPDFNGLGKLSCRTPLLDSGKFAFLDAELAVGVAKMPKGTRAGL